MDEKWNALEKYNLWNGNHYQLGLIRTAYTDRLHAFTGNRLVKVLIGQRRAGKSYILRQIASELISIRKVNPNNILYVNKEYLEFDFIETYQDLEKLYQLYRQKQKPEGKVYLFFDEIQNIEGWERFVNSHSQDFVEECELFISGSNSKMLSSELATLLSGRYVEFSIFPYSYAEYLQVTRQEEGRSSYLSYLKQGGLPELYNLRDQESQKQYVSSVKDTILLRDIVQRKPIRDVRLLDDLFIYLVNNASNMFSIQNVINFFKSKNRKVSYDTLANYTGYIEETLLVHKAERYNIKGKDVLAGNCKYYLNDLAFKNFLYPGYAYGIGYLLENAVYLELLRHDFQVYTGALRNKEVDFVAMKDDRIIYFQVAYTLEDEETREREYAPLLSIADSYEKLVVSMDEVQLPIREGVRHVQAWQLAEEF
ncbi:ATP-binding protein [Bacteroides sp. GD17]|jgi:predicted AAA+ superfamily ATPase|uniref:ATP-binding protein n=1 Tax=Bacteroides sp. GD17 TaxID=3139826 RepID=UPI0025F63AF7|nr:ATP-binding protein [uncultured Bacteroides sp.]